MEGDEDLLVRILPSHPSLLSKHPDNIERNATDRDLLPDHRRPVRAEHLGNGVAEHGHAFARHVVAVREHRSCFDGVIVDVGIVGRRGHNADIGVLGPVFHLPVT